MNGVARALLAAAALAGLTAVAFAAIGAHAVQGADAFDTWRSWQAASVIHLVHAPALLALAALANHSRSSLWPLAGGFMVLGIVLFSGSIYSSILSSGGSTGLAPVGGFSLMLGWLLLALAAFTHRARGQSA